MSFEGYYQTLCKNGHAYCFDCYESKELEDIKCPHCKEHLAWWNLVDTTNGSFDDDGKRIDGEVKLRKYERGQKCVCPTCKNNHTTGLDKYHIPTGKGHLVNG